MTNLSVFDFNSQLVRVILVDSEPWFVAKDLCSILDISNMSQALTRLDDDEKNTIILNDGTPGNPNTSVISESGLYALVLSSRKPEAKPFRKWVTSEVLPSIRKNGSYSAIAPTNDEYDLICHVYDQVFKNVPIKPELVAGLKLNAAQKILPAIAPHIEESRQLLINSAATENPLVTVTELGKSLGLSAQKVNQLLIEKGLQTKNPNKKSKKDLTYVPTDRGSEFASVVLSSGKKNDTNSYQQLRWDKQIITLF